MLRMSFSVDHEHSRKNRKKEQTLGRQEKGTCAISLDMLETRPVGWGGDSRVLALRIGDENAAAGVSIILQWRWRPSPTYTIVLIPLVNCF